MLTTLVLLFGLTVATAVIAYWSDNLGKKLGKKRVSLLGLRPRTTATVLTIVSSWGIMLFTVIVLLIVWAPLRHALLRYDEERRQNARLIQDTDQLRAESSKLRNSVHKAGEALSQKTHQISQMEQNLDASQQRLQDSSAHLKVADLSLYRAVTGEKEAKLGQERAILGRRQAEVQVHLAQEHRAAIKLQLTQVQLKFKQVRQHLQDSQQQLSDSRVKLQVASGKYTAQLGSIAKQYETEANLQADISQYRTELAALTDQRSALQAQVADLQQTTKSYQALTETFAATAPRLAINQVLSAQIFPAQERAPLIQAQLVGMLTQAQQVLPGMLGTSKTVDVELAGLPWPPGPQPTVLQGPEILELLSKTIAANQQTVSVRLVAARNSFQGEELPNQPILIYTRFVVVAVKPVLKEGDVLATAEIDGHQTDARLFSALYDLIEVGRKLAVSRDVNPPQTPGTNFYAADTNELLFLALRKLGALDRVATVRIVAAKDLSTVDPLEVRFDVQ